MSIRFYNTTDVPYGVLSNFAKYGFYADGLFWHTTEHYFQAQKYNYVSKDDRVWQRFDAIQQAATPKIAAQLGRDTSVPMLPYWNDVRDAVMYQALKYKFTAYPRLQKLLIATEQEEIIEDSKVDWYWGCGGDGFGKNKLGKLLMRLREEVQQRSVKGTVADEERYIEQVAAIQGALMRHQKLFYRTKELGSIAIYPHGAYAFIFIDDRLTNVPYQLTPEDVDTLYLQI